MVRRNSNQRITKIKRDIDLDLLKQAELIPVEQGCTVMNPGDNLIPYPTINNLRSWVRKYLLSGINGIFISGVDYKTNDKYWPLSSSSRVRAPGRKECMASGNLLFTTVLDGLIINTSESKVIACSDSWQEDELVPKPGLQLSNFKYLYSKEISVPQQSDGTTTKIARLFRESRYYRYLSSTQNEDYLYYLSGTIIPTYLGQGCLKDSSNNLYSYNWHYWDNCGILNRNSGTNNYIFERLKDTLSGSGTQVQLYTQSLIKWYNQASTNGEFRCLWTFPINFNNQITVTNDSAGEEAYFTFYSGNLNVNIYSMNTARNSSLLYELSSSLTTNSIGQKINVSDGVTTKELFIGQTLVE